MMVTATGLGATAVIVGLLLSWHLGTAAGATVAAVAVLTFFIVLVARDLASRLSHRSRHGRDREAGDDD
jgi:ABC-type Mn2+/Zn2+ transport system permease subunit